MSSTRPANHHGIKSAGDSSGQPCNRVFERHRLKARLGPIRGLKSHGSARILAAGHAFVQNLRRGHYDIATDVSGHPRLQKAFDDLAITI